MNCKRARRLLPLFVGKDLSPRKMSGVGIHLNRCDACQEEYETYRASLMRAREWLSQERKEWDDREWEMAVQNAVIDKPVRVFSLMPWPYKKSWAYALMVLLVIIITIFVVRPTRVDLGETAEIFPPSKIPSGNLKEKAPQQVVSMTLVSRQTGLKITWFFNKDFDFKEEK